MAIYRYTLKKYVKAPSTWIIMAIAGPIIGFLIGAVLPFTLINKDQHTVSSDYITITVATTSGIASFLSLFISVFAGFKAATMYKDEVEDGTFLIILSKPISRSKIIFMKWFALQTLIAIYTLVTVLCFVIGVLIFDVGDSIPSLKQFGVKSLSSQILSVGAFLLLIFLVMGLIFSSIALLLSTKISVGTTIGISISIGVLIPITSLFGTFLRKPEYRSLNNGEYEFSVQAVNNTIDELTKNNLVPSVLDPNYLTSVKQRLATLDSYVLDPTNQVYNLAGATRDKDGYKYGWLLDLNFQVGTLASYAYEQAIPSSARELVASIGRASAQPGFGGTYSEGIKPSINGQNSYNNLQKLLTEFNPVRNDLAYLQTRLLLLPYLLGAGTTLTADIPAALKTNLLGIIARITQIPNHPALNALRADLQGTTPTLRVATIIGLFTSYFYDFDDAVGAQDNVPNYIDLIDSAHREDTDARGLKVKLYTTKGELMLALRAGIEKVNGIETAPLDEFTRLVSGLDSPLSSFFINSSRLNTFMGDYDLSAGAVDLAKYEAASPVKNFMSTDDEKALRNLLAIAENDRLYTAKTSEYVNRNVILGVYLAIAAILVPLTYLIVRRQDFR